MPALNSSCIETTEEPSDPADTVTTSTAPSASPTGSSMIGTTGTPPVAAMRGRPAGIAWRNQPGVR